MSHLCRTGNSIVSLIEFLACKLLSFTKGHTRLGAITRVGDERVNVQSEFEVD